MGMMEAEIKTIAKLANLKEDVAIVPFYALIIRYYFLHKMGNSYAKKIDCLIKDQFPDFDKSYHNFNDEILSSLERVSSELIINGNIDLIGNIYDQIIEKKLKKIFGQFYTPLPIVKHILNAVDLKSNLEGKIIDISCGAGIFLSEAVKLIINEGDKEDENLLDRVVSQIYGFDIDQNACILTKLSLLLSTFPLWKNKLIRVENFKLNFNIKCSNALMFLPGHTNYIAKFDFVVGNPPFIEAKRLSKEDKKICLENFSDVAKGAFDIYICFLRLGIDLLIRNGSLGYVLPNKFLVAKYGKSIRRQLIENYAIKEICDISNLTYFNGANVYPILFILKRHRAKREIKVASRLKNKSEFEIGKFAYINIPQEKYKIFSDIYPFYLFESRKDKSIFFKILKYAKNNIGDYLDIKTTVSFHIKGLREKYISKSADSNLKYKYLGGESYSRKNEVSDFSVHWNGYYINYASEKLRKICNPLPPLANFLRPKIIFCQHAKRMLSFCDVKGEWVAKDVFPIAYLKNGDFDLVKTLYYTGLFNSNIFSYIYSIIYKGIQINDGYFHFLPNFLSLIPVPMENESTIKNIAKLTSDIQSNKIKKDTGLKKINQILYRIYNVKNDDIKRIEEYNKLYL